MWTMVAIYMGLPRDTELSDDDSDLSDDEAIGSSIRLGRGLSTSDIVAVKWKDNNDAILLSNCHTYQMGSVQRWDRTVKKYVAVRQPGNIKEYNKYMGFVDLLDGTYRIRMRQNKWWWPIFSYFVSVAGPQILLLFVICVLNWCHVIMSTAIVLGGGISGLATAYYLRKLAGQTVSKVILIEKSKRFGGWVNSYYDNNNGVVHELGPRSIRFRATGTVGCNTLQLIEDLNLSDEVLKVTEKEANVNKRYILHKGKIIEMPNSKFFATPPFKKSLFHYALKDLFASKPKVDDESLYNFFSKRYGHEISDVFIDPLCRGIVAGDAKEISVRSLFPLYFKAAKERGSLILGMMSENKKNAREVRSLNSALCYKASTERWSMWNLRKGLNQLPDALENWLKNDKHVQVISESSCDRIQFSDGCTKVYTGNECFEGKHVVSCLPSFELSKTIAHDHPDLASVLDRIKFVNVAVINFEFTGSVLPIKTFGYLIPSSDPSKVLGVVFDSCNFSKHDGHDENDTDRTRLTCMLGGHWFNEYFGDVETVDENILLETSLHELKTRLNITEKPVSYHITVQKNCIPQYKVGHHEIVDCLKTMLQEKKLPLSISGSSFEGVSVNDVIYNSRTNIEDLVRNKRL
ncbi:Protoporphyrinogen oxidase [Nymphon striatum]|nr:Protoporphyrinogen oxidase [Nymphon striatum]